MCCRSLGVLSAFCLVLDVVKSGTAWGFIDTCTEASPLCSKTSCKYDYLAHQNSHIRSFSVCEIAFISVRFCFFYFLFLSFWRSLVLLRFSVLRSSFFCWICMSLGLGLKAFFSLVRSLCRGLSNILK